jgi:hypothetical protein
MKHLARIIALSLFLSAGALAQTSPPSDGNPQFTQAELDQMLAPIALYPDDLLAQVLMAATYPLEVVEAERWSQAHRGLQGDAAVQAAGNETWDPSVRSLVAFPQVLATMDQKLDWTERLGDAFLAQQSQVMDTVQNLRHKAEQAGNLHSNSEIAVQQDDSAIDIEPANPEIVYVPYYSPLVVYGNWWWPDYPPIIWDPWPDYAWNGDYAWGIGFGVGTDFFFGGWDWRHHHINIHDHHHWFPPGHGWTPGHEPHPWQHDPGHRHGVPYRNAALNQQFGRTRSDADGRQEFRGHQPPADASGSRAQPRSFPQPNAPAPQRAPMQRHSAGEPAPQAFEGIGQGAEVRGYSARGHQSVQSAPARSAPPSRQHH